MPLSGILAFVYAALQTTKVTAEAWQRHHAGDLGLLLGVKIAAICHSAGMLAVLIFIPFCPFLLKPIMLLFMLWAYVGIFYTVASTELGGTDRLKAIQTGSTWTKVGRRGFSTLGVQEEGSVSRHKVYYAQPAQRLAALLHISPRKGILGYAASRARGADVLHTMELPQVF